MKIITLTMNPTIDMSAKVKQVAAEKKLRCSRPSYEAGGGGINVSRAIKNLGGESTAYYTSGGSNGEMLNQILDKEEIDHHPFEIKNMTRENITISEEVSEQQFRFVLPGPEITEAESEKILKEITSLKEPTDFIVASGSLPPGISENFYAEAAKFGKEIGAKVVVDTSGKALKKAVDEGVFLIKPNINEIKLLMESDFQNEDHIADAAKKIITEGRTEVIVVSLGSGGALLITKDICEHIYAPTVKIKSKVGAGDSTVAGIVLHLSRGNSLKDSVIFGVACGAAAVMTPGTELCRKEDAEKLFNRMKSN
jgi:6-phosphofructokinase 2